MEIQIFVDEKQVIKFAWPNIQRFTDFIEFLLEVDFISGRCEI